MRLGKIRNSEFGIWISEMQLGQKSNDGSEEEGSEDEEGLEDETAGDGEGVTATEVAAVVEAVESLEPRWGFFAEITEAGEVVREHRADCPTKEQWQGNRGEGWGSPEHEKHDQGE